MSPHGNSTQQTRFIKTDLVKAMQLKVLHDRAINVTLGNSAQEQTNASVEDKLFLGNDVEFKVRMFCMDLPAGCDIVLGMDFLKKQNVLADFANKRLSVRADDRKRHIIAVGRARVVEECTNEDDEDAATGLPALPDSFDDVQLCVYATSTSSQSESQNVCSKQFRALYGRLRQGRLTLADADAMIVSDVSADDSVQDDMVLDGTDSTSRNISGSSDDSEIISDVSVQPCTLSQHDTELPSHRKTVRLRTGGGRADDEDTCGQTFQSATTPKSRRSPEHLQGYKPPQSEVGDDAFLCQITFHPDGTFEVLGALNAEQADTQETQQQAASAQNAASDFSASADVDHDILKWTDQGSCRS